MQWIEENKEIIAIFIGAGPIIWSILQYVLQKKAGIKIRKISDIS